MTNSPISKRVAALRKNMQAHNLDFYFVPSRDQHNDEYLPAHWQRRGFISGFDGSAGDALVGINEAYLWTDPRYFIHAEQQLDSDIYTLMRQQQGMAAPIHVWLKENAKGKRVGTDPRLMTVSEQQLWSAALESVGGELVSVDENLIDVIWEDQPALTQNALVSLDVRFAGQSAQEKIAAVRTAMQQQGAKAHALNLLDGIAWLYNVRGSDISFNPLAISYALVTENNATLFISDDHLDDLIIQILEEAQIEIKSYDAFGDALKALDCPTLLEAGSSSWWMAQQLKQPVIGNSPVTMMKALKNPIEIAGAHEAHRLDGLALCKLFYWLENNWQGQSELSFANKSLEIRAEEKFSRGPSFNSISSYGPHGAIVHYAVNEETSLPLDDKAIFLFDSGCQYLQGTTDVTRTTHLGTPTTEEVHQYTLVLKGHLALRHCVFPQGTCGEQINAFAHAPLWKEGLDFAHGTGHGVGAYLCVHEGPQRISSAFTHVPIEAGMLLSNEPGYYVEGSHGIRIENLVVVVEKFSADESINGPYYTFEDLTLFPYERKLINKAQLTTEEIAQVDAYHQLVYEKLHMDLPAEISDWLREATQPL